MTPYHFKCSHTDRGIAIFIDRMQPFSNKLDVLVDFSAGTVISMDIQPIDVAFGHFSSLNKNAGITNGARAVEENF